LFEIDGLLEVVCSHMNCDSCSISEMVQDRVVVTAEH